MWPSLPHLPHLPPGQSAATAADLTLAVGTVGVWAGVAWQLTSGDDLQVLINLGGMAAMLGWLMRSVIPRLERIERALNGLREAQLLLTLALPNASPTVRREARRQLGEMGGHALPEKND